MELQKPRWKDAPAKPYRLTLKRIMRLPEGEYDVTINGREYEMQVFVGSYGKGTAIKKIGWFDSVYVSGYKKDSGMILETYMVSVPFGIMRGEIDINDFALVGQKKKKEPVNYETFTMVVK